VHLLCEKPDEKKEHLRSDGNMNSKDDPQNCFWPKLTDLSSTQEEGSSSYPGQAILVLFKNDFAVFSSLILHENGE
jgi:hypothetical protein